MCSTWFCLSALGYMYFVSNVMNAFFIRSLMVDFTFFTCIISILL